jgi:hypothetical protein
VLLLKAELKKIGSHFYTQKIIFFFHLQKKTNMRRGGGVFSQNKINIILNFDVNKTLIAIDPVSGKGVDEVLKGSLTLLFKQEWKKNGVPQVDRPMDYETYIKDVLQVSKEDRRRYVVDFFDYLEVEHPDIYTQAKAQYDKAMGIYNQMKAKHQEIFESFYQLLNYLNTCRNISYQVVIRTFGKDIPEIVKELEHKLGWHMDLAKFKEGKLVIAQQRVDAARFLEESEGVAQIISDRREIYEFIKNDPNHIAIRDDWKWWNSHKEYQEYSKLHLLEEYDTSNVLSIFFDDNVTTTPGSKTNIVAPFNVTDSKNVSMDYALEKGFVYQVDTLKALGDPEYYIKLVNDSIVKNVFNMQTECAADMRGGRRRRSSRRTIHRSTSRRTKHQSRRTKHRSTSRRTKHRSTRRR